MVKHSSCSEDDYIGDRTILDYFSDAQKRFEAGDKSQLMRCVFLCAQFEGVFPVWAADALLELKAQIKNGRISDYNKAFGKPKEKVNTRAARARKAAAKDAVVNVLFHLRLSGSSLNAEEIFGQALEILKEQGVNVNQRDIAEIYAEHGGFIKELPRSFDPKINNYSYGDVTFPEPRRRRGRNILND